MDLLEKLEEVSRLRFDLNKETDRGCALLSVSYLDEELKLLIKKFLVQSKTIQKKIFDNGNGGLATFSAKIDIAFLLGLISKRTYDYLGLIRKIRNEFAHSKYSIDFDNEKVKNICMNLKSHYRDSSVGPRKIFISSIYGILSKINATQNNTDSLKEVKDDSIKERQLQESISKFKSNFNEYYEIIKAAYKDAPNKEKMIQEEMNEYLKDFQKMGQEVASIIGNTTPSNNT